MEKAVESAKEIFCVHSEFWDITHEQSHSTKFLMPGKKKKYKFNYTYCKIINSTNYPFTLFRSPAASLVSVPISRPALRAGDYLARQYNSWYDYALEESSYIGSHSEGSSSSCSSSLQYINVKSLKYTGIQS